MDEQAEPASAPAPVVQEPVSKKSKNEKKGKAAEEPTVTKGTKRKALDDDPSAEPAKDKTEVEEVITQIIAVTETVPKSEAADSKQPKAKKAKIAVETDAATGEQTAVVTESEGANGVVPEVHGKKSKEKKERVQNVPFRRVKEETIKVDPRLADNSFFTKVCISLVCWSSSIKVQILQTGSANDYGAKAARDLIVTKGDGFRKVSRTSATVL